MEGTSVKSFRIVDLLEGKNNVEEKSESKLEESITLVSKVSRSFNETEICEKSVNERVNSSNRESTPVTGGTIDLRKSSISPISSPSSSMSGAYKSERSPITGSRPSAAMKYYEAGNISGGLYQYHNGYPMVFPISSTPVSATTNRSEREPVMKNYSTLLPYCYDSFRQNRQLFGRHHSPFSSMMLPSVPSITHGSQLSQGLEYPLYQSFSGLYGMPIPGSVTGLHDKGSLIGSRDNFPMFHLGRAMYPVTCKRKGGQIRFSSNQTAQLEKAFVQQKYLNANDRKKLAHSLSLSDRQVKTWFQNRRAKLRKCKGGLCTESEASGSPQDLRALSPQNENIHYDNRLDAKTVAHFSGSE